MNVPGGYVEFWSNTHKLVDHITLADLAILKLPTLEGGRCSFNLRNPVERATLEGVLVGLDHGRTLGMFEKTNDVRAILGVELLEKLPTLKGPRRG